MISRPIKFKMASYSQLEAIARTSPTNLFVFHLFDLGKVFVIDGQLGGDAGGLLQDPDNLFSIVNELLAELVFPDSSNVEALDELVVACRISTARLML